MEAAYPGVPIRIIGILWHQGESDSAVDGSDNVITPSLEYTTNFATFEAAFRGIDSRMSTAPIFVSNLYFYDPVRTAENYINAAMSAYANSHQNVYYIETIVPYMRNKDVPDEIKIAYPNNGLNDDDHNSHQYQIKAGELIFDKMVEIGILN